MMIDESSASRYYYFYDGLGSVCALSHTNGTIAEQYRGACPERRRGNAFGNTRIYSGQGTEITDPAQFLGNPYMFTGRRYDAETGLYYYRARMYNPRLGRFMQTDPIGYYDSMNLYQYCGNNPLNWIDPWGLAASGSTITTPATRGKTKPIVPNLPGSGTRQDPYIITDKDLLQAIKNWHKEKGRTIVKPSDLEGCKGDTEFYDYSDSYFKYNGNIYTGEEVNYIGVGAGARRFLSPLDLYFINGLFGNPIGWQLAKKSPDNWNQKKYNHPAEPGENEFFEYGYKNFHKATRWRLYLGY